MSRPVIISHMSFIASPMTKKHMPDWTSDKHCQDNSFAHRRVLWCRTDWGPVIHILNSLTEQHLIQRIHIRWNPLDAMSWERLASLPQKIRLKPFKSCTLFWQVLYWRIVDWCFLFSLLETMHHQLSWVSTDPWARNQSLKSFQGFKVDFVHSVAQYVFSVIEWKPGSQWYDYAQSLTLKKLL